jgi:pimeloyl-ACP methyl ester carboxylesterase
MRDPPEALRHLRLASTVAALDIDEFVLPAEHDAVIDGLRLHYLDWGRRDRPPLLFLHGGCLTAHTWDLVCLALCREYRCVALDQRGHGDSEWSPTLDYGTEAHVRDIRGLIEHLELRSPVLVGQSLGGLNAVSYALQSSEAPAGLVTIDVGPDVRQSGLRRVAEFVTGDDGDGTFEGYLHRAREFNPRRDPRLLRSSLRHNLRRRPDGAWTWKYDRRGLSPEYIDSVRTDLDRLRGRLADITCPVLVVRGADSDAFGDADAARFAAALPDGRWTRVENAGHTVQGDNPRGLVDVLGDFLAEIGCSRA